MRQLKFPSYEYIKSLPRTIKESEDKYEIGLPLKYEWTLFDTPIYTPGVLSYNDDGSGYIFFDVWEGGYTGMNDLGLALKFNKSNYAKICKHAQNVYEEFYRELNVDYSDSWEKYGENN